VKKREAKKEEAAAQESSESEGGKANKIKLDEGFKKLLRGSRKAFREGFANAGLDNGKHHWSEEKWLERSEEYLEAHLKLKNVTNFEIAATTLLLYHSFGPTKNKPADPKIYKQLGGDQGM
jgi:hypothetical protein